MEQKKNSSLNKPLKPISASEAREFIIKNKEKFISEFGQEKYDQTIAEYKTHLGNRKKSARENDLELIKCNQ